MNIATGDDFNSSDEGLAQTVLHEFQHLAGRTHLHLDDGSDDPNDAIYSCAGFCEACISGLARPSASACSTCTNVANRQAYCGQKQEVIIGPPPGVLPAATCHTYVGLVSHCEEEIWRVTVDCNGTIDYSPQNIEYLCCQQCEKILDDVYYPDVDCGPVASPGTVTSDTCARGPTCP